MNTVFVPVRRNATAQDIQHIADLLAGLNLEAEGAAQILEAIDGALTSSFYAALTHSPLAAVAKDMRERVAEFFQPRRVLTQELRAEAVRFAACTGLDEQSLEQGEPA